MKRSLWITWKMIIDESNIWWMRMVFKYCLFASLPREDFQFDYIHPQSLTWNLKMMVSNRNLLFQGLTFRFHVKLQGCNIFLMDWNNQLETFVLGLALRRAPAPNGKKVIVWSRFGMGKIMQNVCVFGIFLKSFLHFFPLGVQVDH